MVQKVFHQKSRFVFTLLTAVEGCFLCVWVMLLYTASRLVSHSECW